MTPKEFAIAEYFYREVLGGYGEEDDIFGAIERDYSSGYLTINTIEGRNIMWYMDEDRSMAVYMDTLEQVPEHKLIGENIEAYKGE